MQQRRQPQPSDSESRVRVARCLMLTPRIHPATHLPPVRLSKQTLSGQRRIRRRSVGHILHTRRASHSTDIKTNSSVHCSAARDVCDMRNAMRKLDGIVCAHAGVGVGNGATVRWYAMRGAGRQHSRTGTGARLPRISSNAASQGFVLL